MTDAEFDAALSRSGIPFKPETIAELRRAGALMERMIARATIDQPVTAEPALVFDPVQRAPEQRS